MEIEELILLAVFTFLTHWSLFKNLPLASQPVDAHYLIQTSPFVNYQHFLQLTLFQMHHKDSIFSSTLGSNIVNHDLYEL